MKGILPAFLCSNDAETKYIIHLTQTGNAVVDETASPIETRCNAWAYTSRQTANYKKITWTQTDNAVLDETASPIETRCNAWAYTSHQTANYKKLPGLWTSIVSVFSFLVKLLKITLWQNSITTSASPKPNLDSVKWINYSCWLDKAYSYFKSLRTKWIT